MEATEPKERSQEAPEFTVFVTCYYEEKSIDEFYGRLSATMESLGRPYEILMVNDGSLDGTWSKLKAIFEKDPNVAAVVDFFKNAGQQAAITALIGLARGRVFILMDSDLQLAPEEIPMLVAEYDKGFDLVSGYRKNRRDSFFRIVPSKIANMIMRKASQSTFRDFGCTFKIYNAGLIRAFSFGPHHVFSNVDAIAKAGRCREVAVTHYPRKYGKSGWTFRKLWQYNMDNVVKLSQRPFQILAAACVFVSFLFFCRILSGFLLPYKILDEVTTGLVLNALVVAVLLLIAVLSLIGEFTIRCFLHLQKTPAYIVREKLTR